MGNIITSKLYFLLGVSVLFFLAKGVQYALIGSYVPLIFIAVIIIGLYWSFTSTVKIHRRVLRFWAILLILWAIVRLVLWLVLQIDVSLTESHLREQFGIVQHMISIGLLGIGILMLQELRKQKADH